MTRLFTVAFVAVSLLGGVTSSPSPAWNLQTILGGSSSNEANTQFAGWSWENCADETFVTDIQSIEVSPDPPKPGQDLSINVKGYVSSTIQDGAWADVTVKLGLIKLLQKSFDICDEAKKANATVQCPIEPGDYDVTQVVALPKEIPPAKFTVAIRAYGADEADLACVNLKADFMPSRFGN